jgi:hypothetical protein
MQQSLPGIQPYPVQFSVDYPERPLNRLTTAFRIFTIIPIAIIVGLLEHPSVRARNQVGNHWFEISSAGAMVVLPVVLMLLFRQKYPRWWFDWNLELSRFTNRVTAYLALMDDRYPSTDEHQSVHLEFPQAAGPELNRWLPLVKWFLAIPHYIVLFFLGIAAFFVVIFAWFAILFTGRYPRGAFEFVEGVLRWGNRVGGYAFALVTDRYPPFSLSP